MSAQHMEEEHKIEIICYKFIWDAIKQEYERRSKIQKKKGGLEALKKIPRQELYLEWKERLVKVINYNQKELEHVYKNRQINENNKTAA